MYNKKSISIVGAGVSCIVALAQLVHNKELSKKISDIFIFDRNDIGRCTTYSPESYQLLMNTSIGISSIYNDKPNHCYEWVKLNKHKWIEHFPGVSDLNKSSFLPRKIYGEYLVDTAISIIEFAKKKLINIHLVKSFVFKIVKADNQQLIFTKNETYQTDFVLIGSGKVPFEQPSYSHLNDSPNYFPSPYVSSDRYKKLSKKAKTLIIGTRLSAIDAVRLLNEHNNTGEITLVSKSGKLPAMREEVLPNEEILKQYTKIPSLLSLANKLEKLTCRSELCSIDSNQNIHHSQHLQWQQHIMPFVLRARALWEQQNQNEKLHFQALLNRKLNRYVSACPVNVASEISHLVQQGRLRVLSGIPEIRYKNNMNIYEAKINNIINEYDCVINATNRGEYSFSETLSLFQNMNISDSTKNHETLGKRIYIIGAANESNEIIINSIFTIVSQVTKVISKLGTAL